MSLDVYLSELRPVTVFERNITHNLARMADAAGLYMPLWRPELLQATRASHLIGPIERGIETLKSDKARFKEYEPENGWGSYDGLLSFAEYYLAACREYPDAEVSVSR